MGQKKVTTNKQKNVSQVERIKDGFLKHTFEPEIREDQILTPLKKEKVGFGEAEKSAKHYLLDKTATSWISNHNLATRDEFRKMVDFAKELFLSWDTDYSNTMEEWELVKPMISLNLVPNFGVAKIICSALDPTGNKQGKTLTMKADSFVRILKPDPLIDKLISLLD